MVRRDVAFITVCTTMPRMCSVAVCLIKRGSSSLVSRAKPKRAMQVLSSFGCNTSVECWCNVCGLDFR